ncbi:MAG TPA: ribosome-associated translation inhibitor RaiA [Bryobacteraceae bacterium]|nr:ribosome-associated translation inhibitor RaiA [Bryobacteraceae bacterium]
MKVTYTGRQMDLSPAQSQKLTAEFEKVGKLLDNGKGEAGAHVVLSHERHLNNVEITVSYHNHELVGESSDPDLFSAIHAAVGKLEKQAVKVREKWRDGKRIPRKETDAAGEEGEGSKSEAEASEAETNQAPRS